MYLVPLFALLAAWLRQEERADAQISSPMADG
jgi:hypothetical protein